MNDNPGLLSTCKHAIYHCSVHVFARKYIEDTQSYSAKPFLLKSSNSLNRTEALLNPL